MRTVLPQVESFYTLLGLNTTSVQLEQVDENFFRKPNMFLSFIHVGEHLFLGFSKVGF